MAKVEQPDLLHEALSKAPQATLMFWLVKICATTVGETGGDALPMTLNLGYATVTLIFLAYSSWRWACRCAGGATIPFPIGSWWWRRPRWAPPLRTSSTAACTSAIR
jgi:hypothetical protein